MMSCDVIQSLMLSRLFWFFLPESVHRETDRRTQECRFKYYTSMVLVLPSISHILVSYVTVEPVKKRKVASKQNLGRITFVSIPGRQGATVEQTFLARHIGFKWLRAILLLNMVLMMTCVKYGRLLF